MKSVVSQQKAAKATNEQKKVDKKVASSQAKAVEKSSRAVKATPITSVKEHSTAYQPGPKSSKAIKFSPTVEIISKPGPKSSKKIKSIQETPMNGFKSSNALKFKSNQLNTMIEESPDEEHDISIECNQKPGPKSSKAIKSTAINSLVLDSNGESVLETSSASSLLRASTTPLSSPSFVLTADFARAPNRVSEATTIEDSTLYYTDDESNSCIGVITLEPSPAKKSKGKKIAYTFSMIETDDSTDDEDDVENKPFKRPPPPEWSVTENRLETIVRQTAISARLIDEMFGEAPEVDLREIFPDISKELLKRRDSSFIWHTPPRYSILPKY